MCPPAKSEEDLEKVTVRLFKEDIATLKDFYKNAGYTKAIRTLVRKHVKALRENVNARISKEVLDYE